MNEMSGHHKIPDYRLQSRQHVTPGSGNLLRDKEKAIFQDPLPFYRGLLHNVDMVKDALKAAKVFIEKVGK